MREIILTAYLSEDSTQCGQCGTLADVPYLVHRQYKMHDPKNNWKDTKAYCPNCWRAWLEEHKDWIPDLKKNGYIRLEL